jgi:serine/threonine-protein kinase
MSDPESMDDKTERRRGAYATETDVGRVSTIVSPAPGSLHDPASAAEESLAPARYGDRGLLGTGGMGEVRLSWDAWIGREVAVKTVRAADAAGDPARARLLREARVQGQLEHPGIVPVYDLGVDEAGQPHFSMKRVAGRTLRGLLTTGAASRNKLLGIFRQVCLAVEFAHRRGVIHRDIKPENIMVGDFGEVYLLDWGLAKVMDPGDARAGAPRAQTQAGDMLGTPGYMAPEQIGAANEANERSDVYSLGAILFEILAQEPLHRGKSHEDVLWSTRNRDGVRPSTRCDLDIPPELDELCHGATRLLPKNRIESARALADAAERYLEGDRDLEGRRKLAAEHATLAEAAANRASAGGKDANEERARALREAGRALALDPSAPEALRIATRLMLEPPATLPEEVRVQIEQAASQAMRERAKVAAFVFTFFLLLLIVFPFTHGVRSWGAYAAVVAATALTSGVGLFLWLAQIPFAARRSAILATTGCAYAAIVAASWITTPVVLVPAFVIGLATTTMADGLRENVRHYIVLGLAAILVPAVLSYLGMLPAVDYREDGMFLRSLTLRKMPSEFLFHLSAVVTYLGASVSIWLSVRGQSNLRERWLVQLWHLRAMTAVDSEADRSQSLR